MVPMHVAYQRLIIWKDFVSRLLSILYGITIFLISSLWPEGVVLWIELYRPDALKMIYNPGRNVVTSKPDGI